MNQVFADTSFYAALVNRRDQYHQRAKVAAADKTRHVVTSEFVLIEVANFCTAPKKRTIFIRLVERLQNDTGVTVLPASADLFQKGFALFAARMDQSWSLTDCISFAIMQDQRISEALAADHNFEQAGFRALLL